METERVCKGFAAETFTKPFCQEGLIWTSQGISEKAAFQVVIGTTSRSLKPAKPSVLIMTAGRVF